MKYNVIRPFTIAAILLLCAALNACSDISVEKVANTENSLTVYTIADKSDTNEKFDSALYYFQKHIDYKLKKDEAEIKYLRTGEDRYRVEGNRYVDSSHFYSKKLQRLSAVR